MINQLPNSRIYTNPQQAYKQAAVETASKEKLLVMLYSAAIKFLHQGKSAILAKEYEAANESLLRVQDIVSELNATLNMELGGQIANNLRLLYEFYGSEIMKANIKKDAGLLDPVITFFETFRDVWNEAAKIARTEGK